MARAVIRAKTHNLDHRSLWWGLIWTGLNVGLVVMIVALASTA